MKTYQKWQGEARVEPKVDGVYARVTKDGVVSKTGKPIETVPHIAKALKRHFKKNPNAVVEGDLHRKGQDFEKTLGKFRGGDAVPGKRLKLYVHGEEKPSRLTRHVKRVPGKVVKSEEALQKRHAKHLRKRYEGSVVKRKIGEQESGKQRIDARKLKPEFDEELPVVSSRVRKDGKAGVVTVRGRDGKTMRVQGSAAEIGRAKAGDRVTVVYSKSSGGAVRGARMKAVRNRDFSERWEFASAGRKKLVDAVRKVVRKVPKEVRRGAVLGSVVPVPGATAVGAGVGGAAILKRAVEDVVRKRTGRPYRMFDTGNKVMNLQPKDVKQMNDRDKIAKTRDVVDIGSKVATGGAAVGAGLAVRKVARNANTEIGRVSREVRNAAKRTNAEAVVGEVTKRAKKRVGDAFPTVRRVVKALTKKRKFFEAYEFGGRDQLKNVDNNRYENPLRISSGMAKGYHASDPKKQAVDLPVKNAQVIRAAYNQGKKIQRVTGRAGNLARDAKDVVTGKERRRDAAGRKKKREWEKSWFKKAAGSAAAGAAVLGYTGLLKKNPQIKSKNKVLNKVLKKVAGKNHNKHVRTVHTKAVRGVKDRVNRVVPDAFTDFAALDAVIDMHLHEFDDSAARAGWDVRDPRGRSARVFAPGSRKRERREKRWHEKAENERKLWKAGIAGGVLVGAALRPGARKLNKVLKKVAAKRKVAAPSVKTVKTAVVQAAPSAGRGRVPTPPPVSRRRDVPSRWIN